MSMIVSVSNTGLVTISSWTGGNVIRNDVRIYTTTTPVTNIFHWDVGEKVPSEQRTAVFQLPKPGNYKVIWHFNNIWIDPNPIIQTEAIAWIPPPPPPPPPPIIDFTVKDFKIINGLSSGNHYYRILHAMRNKQKQKIEAMRPKL